MSDMSTCNKCGQKYPTAPSGVIHKCQCSGGYMVPDTSEALTAPNEDAPKGFVKLDEFLLAQYVEYLRQYTPEELAKHDITLAEPKDWATELWVDLMDAWNYKSWAQEIRNGFIVDNDQKAIELLRTRFEQMIAERSKRDD